MPLDLLKRGEVAQPITATQLDDQIVTPIESFVNALETNLAGKQPQHAILTAIAALSIVADRLIYSTGVNTFALATLTSAGRALLDDADAAAQRVTLAVPYRGASGEEITGLWRGTQAQYDAIGTKDSTRLYVIV